MKVQPLSLGWLLLLSLALFIHAADASNVVSDLIRDDAWELFEKYLAEGNMCSALCQADPQTGDCSNWKTIFQCQGTADLLGIILTSNLTIEVLVGPQSAFFNLNPILGILASTITLFFCRISVLRLIPIAIYGQKLYRALLNWIL